MTSIIIAIVIVAVLLIFIASSHARISHLDHLLEAAHQRIDDIEHRVLPAISKGQVISKVVDNGMGPGKKVSGQ